MDSAIPQNTWHISPYWVYIIYMVADIWGNKSYLTLMEQCHPDAIGSGMTLVLNRYIGYVTQHVDQHLFSTFDPEQQHEGCSLQYIMNN